VHSFDHYVALCRADPDCSRAYPDPASTIANALRNADLHPLTVTINPNGLPLRVRLDGDQTARALANALANSPGYILAAANAPLSESVAQAVAEQASVASYFWTRPLFPLAVFLSTRCSYTLSNPNPGKGLSSQTRPEFSGVDYDNFLQWDCAGWPVRTGPDPLFSPPVSSVPTLIVEGALAWWDTPQGTAALQVGMPNSNLLLFPTLGAGPLSGGVPPCLNDVRRAFLKDPTKHLDTTACARQSPAVDFITSLK
jgi:hypothetical protein